MGKGWMGRKRGVRAAESGLRRPSQTPSALPAAATRCAGRQYTGVPPVASLKYTLMRSSCRSLSPAYCRAESSKQGRWGEGQAAACKAACGKPGTAAAPDPRAGSQCLWGPRRARRRRPGGGGGGERRHCGGSWQLCAARQLRSLTGGGGQCRRAVPAPKSESSGGAATPSATRLPELGTNLVAALAALHSGKRGEGKRSAGQLSRFSSGAPRRSAPEWTRFRAF